MHGPPLTLDERAALVARQVADLRDVGAGLDRAARVVAQQHRISYRTVTQLLVYHQRATQRRQHSDSAAA